MTQHNFWPGSAFAYLYMLVGVYRYGVSCEPGRYRVIFVADNVWNIPHVNAVCDDYGNLVPVP